MPSKTVLVPKVNKTKKIPKKQNTKCIEYAKVMKYSYSYIVNEFDVAYFDSKDLIGAKAQLFLIENRSQSVFAKNINKAKDTYVLNYKSFESEKCDLTNITKNPLVVIKNRIKNMEAK